MGRLVAGLERAPPRREELPEGERIFIESSKARLGEGWPGRGRRNARGALGFCQSPGGFANRLEKNCDIERIYIELVSSDRKLKASREGSK